MTNKKIAGSVRVRELKTGNYLYFKSAHTNKKWVASGMKDTPLNRKHCWKILEKLQARSILGQEEEKDLVKTVKECFAEFISYCKEVKKLQKSTIENYQHAYNNIVKYDFIVDDGFTHGRRKFYQLEQVAKDFVGETDLSPGSINIYLKGFGSFLSYLYQEGYIHQISLSRYKQQTKRKEIVAYSQKQILDIINYFTQKNKPRIADWILYLYITGSRRTESLNLTWDQVKFNDRYILMPKKNNRTVFDKFPMTDNLIALLQKIKVEAEKRRDPIKRELVFGWIADNAKTYLNKELKAALEHYGYKVKGSLFHPIRKAFATWIIESENSFYAQALMRHEDSQITKDHYWKQDIETQIKLLSKNDKEVFSRVPNMYPKID